jgi:hypothetical protein
MIIEMGAYKAPIFFTIISGFLRLKNYLHNQLKS